MLQSHENNTDLGTTRPLLLGKTHSLVLVNLWSQHFCQLLKGFMCVSVRRYLLDTTDSLTLHSESTAL